MKASGPIKKRCNGILGNKCDNCCKTLEGKDDSALAPKTKILNGAGGLDNLA